VKGKGKTEASDTLNDESIQIIPHFVPDCVVLATQQRLRPSRLSISRRYLLDPVAYFFGAEPKLLRVQIKETQLGRGDVYMVSGSKV
jgi:hypothetical protein